MFTAQSVDYAWDNQLRYLQALLADVSDELMVHRPGDAMNHPAWIVGHLLLYHPAVVALLKGESFADPADDPVCGFHVTTPAADLSVYGDRTSLLQRFASGHEDVAQALLRATPEQFRQRPSLPRWADVYPTVEFLLPDLLLHHESSHIGQISAWRLPPAYRPLIFRIARPDRAWSSADAC